MFGFIDKVALYNVQSHPKSIFNFNGATIHRISAEGTSNSFGKSVLRKSLMTVFTTRGKDKIGRQTLIRKGHESCHIIVSSTTGLLVTLYLHLEEKYCYYELEYGDITLRKYLRDDYQIILDILGFHYLKDEDYSLNFYVTKSTLPFTHFRPRLNYKVLESAKELPEYKMIVEDIADNLSRMEREVRILNNTAGSYQFHIDSLSTIDLESLELEERLVSNWIKYLEPLEQTVPLLKTANASLKELEQIKMIPVTPIKEQVSNLTSLSEINKNLTSLIQLTDSVETLQHQYIDTRVIEGYINHVTTLNDLIRATTTLTDLNEKVGLIQKPLKLDEIDKHRNSLNNVNTLIHELHSFITLNQKLEHLPKPIDSSKVATHLTLANQLEDLQTNISKLAELKRQLESKKQVGLPPRNLLEQLTVVSKTTGEVQQFVNQQNTINHKQQLLDQLNQEVNQLANELDVCVTCGQLITSMEAVHEH